ncbi:MAG: type VI secretion system tip protein VgrG [Bacteroidota bacterium]
MSSNSRFIPSENGTGLPTIQFKVGGTDLTNQVPLLAVSVIHQANRISKAQIVLRDGDPAAEDFEFSNQNVFAPGEEVEILMGYHNNEEPVFKGIVIRQGIEFSNESEPILVVECRHEAIRMTVGRKNAAYDEDSTDSDVIETIIGRNKGLSADVEATSATQKEMIQYYVSDWDFIVTRAEMNSMLVFTEEGNKVVVKKPDSSSSPSLCLTFGDTLYSFQAHMDARYQYPKVRSISWDYADQAIIEEEGDDPGIQEQGNLSSSTLSDVIGLDEYHQMHSGQVVDQELKAWSEATMFRSRLAKVKGTARIQGFNLRPGETVEMQGVGDRFNGNVLITGVRHEFNANNWESELEFGLSRNWQHEAFDDYQEADASGLVPGIPGLQIAKVVQLEEDPDGENRILVKVPVIEDDANGIWARVATLDAGDGRGSFFLPEVDDEVVLGFLNGDPRDPIVLGMLHSSAKPAPLDASDDNHEKGFVTRSEMKLLFNDDTKVITIETPGGNKITISDEDKGMKLEDQNGNFIELGSDGITIESAKDVNIKATGDVNIEGMNISESAQVQYKAEGTAGAEISSSATMVVKGSLVQIN